MGFEQLIDKVTQAEHALEAREREVSANWRHLSASWRAAWTPGRIVVAGLASGFVVGQARPLSRASGGGVLQLMTALSGLVASGSAQAAATEASHAADEAEQTADAVTGAPIARASADASPHDAVREHERMRRSGLV